MLEGAFLASKHNIVFDLKSTFFLDVNCNQIITNQAFLMSPVLPQARIREFFLDSGCLFREVHIM